MTDRFTNIATLVLLTCAIVITATIVRREFFPPPPAAAEGARVPGWRKYAAQGYRMGPADAPITLVVFSDFECGACRMLASGIHQLRSEGDSSFVVVYRNFPLPSHDQALPAAKAGVCAGRQGRFEGLHDSVYAAQDTLARVVWPRLAANIGMDSARFRSCFSSPETAASVEADIQQGKRLGVVATPTLLINGVLLRGAPPVDDLRRLIRHAPRK